MDLERLLQTWNEEFSRREIEHYRRPMEAFRRYLRVSGRACIPGDPESKKASKQINEYFQANLKPGALHAEPCHEAVYFYDAEFWPISIPMFYGSVKLNSFDSISQMPEHTKERLYSNDEELRRYLIFWANCVDYGSGLDFIRRSEELNEDGKRFLFAGDQKLREAVSSLKQPRPGSRSIMSCRMAIEMFLKAFIAFKQDGLSSNQAKKVGHDLDKGLTKAIEVSGYDYLEPLRERLSLFPGIGQRYEELKLPPKTLWEGFYTAQTFAVLAVTENISRDTYKQVMKSIVECLGFSAV